jgi:hypothetical protein
LKGRVFQKSILRDIDPLFLDATSAGMNHGLMIVRIGPKPLMRAFSYLLNLLHYYQRTKEAFGTTGPCISPPPLLFAIFLSPAVRGGRSELEGAYMILFHLFLQLLHKELFD